jgi:hypothetical protein
MEWKEPYNLELPTWLAHYVMVPGDGVGDECFRDYDLPLVSHLMTIQNLTLGASFGWDQLLEQ